MGHGLRGQIVAHIPLPQRWVRGVVREEISSEPYTDPSELLMNQHSGLTNYAVRAEDKEIHEFEAAQAT